MGALQTIKYNIMQLLYPNLCAACNEPLLANEEIICLHCTINLPFTQPYKIDNEIEKTLWGRFAFEKATSVLFFQKNSITQEILFKFKYEKRLDVGEFLAKKLAQHLLKNNFLHNNTILIPVPLAKEKEAKRGFNQSLIICNAVAKELNIPVQNNIIKRIKNTESQTRKTRIERLYNMEDAFIIENLSLLNNKHVILIDDVLTTGATLEACALHLLQNKTCTLSVATIAIATQ